MSSRELSNKSRSPVDLVGGSNFRFADLDGESNFRFADPIRVDPELRRKIIKIELGI
jgi:hypothetical protein